jgi:hypothetical protein
MRILLITLSVCLLGCTSTKQTTLNDYPFNDPEMVEWMEKHGCYNDLVDFIETSDEFQ